jgi:transposase
MCDEFSPKDLESLPLPKDWTANVRHAVLNVIGIVRIAMLAGREFLIQEDKPHLAQVHRLETEVAMLREELRIIGARTSRIDPHQRPQYLPTERMAILELRAMRGWSKAETARRFFVSDDTIRAWLRRADEDSLIQTRTPVNRFPEIVRYVVQRIKLFCPTLGKVKIADKLARAGIHIGKTTVQRILKEKPAKEPQPSDDTGKQSRIVAKYAGHTMHETLGGKTPNEVFFAREAANEQPRLEPRDRWPRSSPCARPQVEIDGEPGDPIVLEIDCLDGRRHLPIIRARAA